MLQADREKIQMDELFELDQKYLLKESSGDEDDIYARESRK